MARGASIEEITREQLNALKDKFELVQGDRRAFFDTYETTKKNNEVRAPMARVGAASGAAVGAVAGVRVRRAAGRLAWAGSVVGGGRRPLQLDNASDRGARALPES